MSADRLRSIAPVFPVADVDAAAAWYRDELDFEIFPFPADPPWAFAILLRDGVEIFLERVEGFVKHAVPGRRPESWDAYVRIADLAALWERVAHLPGARGPERQFYGDTEIELVDPNGYRLVFGEGSGEAAR